MAYLLYGACTVVFVVLLCVRILPSCSRYGTVALILTQLLVMGVAQVQDSTFKQFCADVANLPRDTQNMPPSIYQETLRSKCPRNFWWLAVLGTYFLCWLVMFITIPVQMSRSITPAVNEDSALQVVLDGDESADAGRSVAESQDGAAAAG